MKQCRTCRLQRVGSIILPLFMEAKSCEKNSSFYATFWTVTFAFETFAARPPWGEESFGHGTGRIRRRDRLLFIEQRQQASTPFTRHSETGQSDTKSTGNQVGDATSGTIRLQSKKGILGDTLCGINCGCRLSRHV